MGVALSGYIILVKLFPYLLERWGVQIDPTFGAYPWNFSPVMAICLFGGSRFLRPWTAWLASLGGMLVADLAIFALKGPDFALSAISIAVYLSFALGLVIAHGLRKTGRSWPLFRGGLLAETVFFLITNFLVWITYHNQPPMHYAFDAGGLMRCYLNALPYFGRSLLGTLFYGSFLFGSWALISRIAESRASAPPWVTRDA
ncbi:MAG: DUF6580 family putative transport protein [Verrucomicrobiota bacterium]